MLRTIRSRLVLLSLAWAVPVVATSVAAAWWTRSAAVDSEAASNLDLARTTAASFRAYVEGLADESAVLGAVISGEGLDLDAASRLLALAAAKRPAVRWFLWTDASGRVLAASSPEARGLDLAGRDYVKALRSGEDLALGDLAEAKLGGGPVFGLAVAVRAEPGHLEHMVVAAIDPDRLEERALAGLRAERATVSIHDRTGRMVFRSPHAGDGWHHRRTPARQDIVHRALQGEAATGEVTSDVLGDRRIGAAIPIPPHGWVARAATPLAVVTRPLRRDIVLRGAVVVLLALGGALASILIGRWIVGPLNRLGAQAAAWRVGRLGERVREGPAEVRALSETLEAMGRGLLAERSQLEEVLGQLREVDRNKDEFLAVLSHELRNPLAPIRNSLAILDRVPPGSDAARRAQAVISRQVNHVTRLVDDLLDVSRITRGKIELRHAAIDLTEVVRRAADDHKELFERAGVEFEVSVPGGDTPIVGDDVRLAQVIGNLLQNAARFTPPGGAVRLALEREEDRATVRVADNGAGIAPEVRERLFEPFMQGPQGPARSHGGLGLGLALVRGLAVLHGGSVEARSDGPGRGAEFLVHLPVAESRAWSDDREERPSAVQG